MNPEEDANDDFLDTIRALDDPSSMMLVDDMFDFVKTEPTNYVQNNMYQAMCMPAKSTIDEYSVNVNIGDSQQLLALKEELHSSSDGDTGSDNPFDPNDFFNDLYKSEVSYSSFSSPSYRDTPSPSHSQSSGSDQSSDYNSLLCTQQPESRVQLYAGQQCRSHDIASMDLTQKLITIPEQQTQSVIPIINQMVTGPATAAGTANKVNIIQGTLIPLKAVSLSPPHNTFATATNVAPVAQTTPMKKIKIQPKPTQTPNGSSIASIQKANTKPKTIVLSASDYKALMLKCKSQPALTTLNDKFAPLTLKTNATVPVGAPAAAHNNFNTKVIKLLSAAMAPTAPPTSMAATAPMSRLMPVDVQPIKFDAIKMSNRPKVNGIKQEIDDRTLKKQMRMIKNRESACLSRQKKKNYVNTLEARISDLSKENQQLKSDNSVLRERLGNMVNSVCDICGGLSASRGKLGKLSALSNVPKKNAAFLLAFVFMVSLQVGPYLSNQMPNIISTPDSSISLSQQTIGTRRLLWIDDLSNDSNARPASDDGMNGKNKAYPMCPVTVSVNQTESIRLASELQRWIGDFPEYFNISKNANSKDPNNKFDLNQISDYLLSDAGGRAIKTFYKQMKNARKNMKMPSKVQHENNPSPRKLNRPENGFGVQTTENRVQVYNADAIKYAEFFDEIRRQDDTFYVVSFSGDHLLLPAVAHNKTFRPKMSLMLPAVGNVGNGSYNGNGMFTLMQIDCEVVNTSILHIKQSAIPDHLWNRTSSMPTTNKSSSDNSTPMASVAAKSSTKAERIQQNLPMGPESIVDRINRHRLLNNITADGRRSPHVLPMETANGGDAVASAMHVEPLKPHRPYFLHKNDDTNVLNEV